MAVNKNLQLVLDLARFIAYDITLPQILVSIDEVSRTSWPLQYKQCHKLKPNTVLLYSLLSLDIGPKIGSSLLKLGAAYADKRVVFYKHLALL